MIPMKVALIACLLALPLLPGCATSDRVPEDQAARRHEEAVHAVMMDQQSRWNAGDIPGFMEGYWRSEDLVFTSGGKVRRGFDAALAGYEKNYTRETMGRLEFSDLEFTHISYDAMLVLGRWALHDVPDPSDGVFTLLFRRINGAWRVVHDHTSATKK